MQEPTAVAQVDWTMLANLGVPMLVLGAIGIALWKIGGYALRKLFGTDTTPGYVGQLVIDEREFKGGLVQRMEQLVFGQQTQQTICARHADLMESVSGSLAESSQSQQASVVALQRLVEIHEGPGGIVVQASHDVSENKHDLRRVKKSIIHACEMCRSVSAREFPNSAAEVAKHCDEIEKTIGEA